MRKHGLLWAIASLLLGGFLFSAAGAADPPPILERIQARADQVREYTCVVERFVEASGGPLRKVTLRWKTEQGFRRPGHFYAKESTLESPSPTVQGQFQHVIMDETTLASYLAPPPDAAQKMMASTKRPLKPKDRIRIRKMYAPSLTRYDLKALQIKGIGSDRALQGIGFFLRPHAFLQDMKEHLVPGSIQLLREDEKTWEISFRFRGEMEGSATVSKSDGLFRYVVWQGQSEETEVHFREINVAPGLSDSVFDTTPPPGLPSKDKTDELIARLKKQSGN